MCNGFEHNIVHVEKLLQAECRTLESSGFHVILAGDLNIARHPIDGYPNLRTFPKQHCLNRADFEARFCEISARNDPPSKVASNGETNTATHEGLGMIDTFRHIHPYQKSYTFYPRTKSFGESCDRVDLILVSSQLEDVLVEAGMHETVADRGTSDHVPLYAFLDFGERASSNVE